VRGNRKGRGRGKRNGKNAINVPTDPLKTFTKVNSKEEKFQNSSINVPVPQPKEGKSSKPKGRGRKKRLAHTASKYIPPWGAAFFDVRNPQRENGDAA